jgi:hypothetical protein
MHAQAPSSLVEPYTPKAICSWKEHSRSATHTDRFGPKHGNSQARRWRQGLQDPDMEEKERREESAGKAPPQYFLQKDVKLGTRQRSRRAQSETKAIRNLQLQLRLPSSIACLVMKHSYSTNLVHSNSPLAPSSPYSLLETGERGQLPLLRANQIGPRSKRRSQQLPWLWPDCCCLTEPHRC